jgi:AraC-like DNA-binding protein
MRFFFWEMILLAFIELINSVYLIEGLWEISYVQNITFSSDMWSIPLAAIFVFEIISPGWIRWYKILAMMLPSVLITFLYIIFAYDALFYTAVIYGNLLGLVTVVIAFTASYKYDKYIKKNFSDIENLSLYWIRQVLLPLYIALFFWTILVWERSWLNDAISYCFFVGIWMFVYYRTVNHVVVEVPYLLNPFTKEEDDEKNENNNAAPDLKQNESKNYFPFAQKLDAYMEKEKLYLDPQLTIMELASAIGTNRTYLSDYLNKQLNTNFYEYVNAFRIKKACSMLILNDIEKLEIIAEECGFNSISTFRRAFIKETGKTPLQYKKSHV